MTRLFLQLFDLSFCIVGPGSIWLQLIQLTCSIFELLIKLCLDDLLVIVARINSNDKVSCASLLDAIGKALAHLMSVAYTCAHLFSLLDTVLANIMSENT